MVKGIGKDICCFLFCGLFLLTVCLSACRYRETPNVSSRENGEETTALPDATATGKIALSADGTALFRIVLPENASSRLAAEVGNLQRKLNTETGTFFTVTDDYTRDGTALDSKGEIIIGDCRRTSAQNALSALKYKDYAVLCTEGNIVLAAYDESTAVKAIQYFSESINAEHLERDGNAVFLAWDGDYTHVNPSYSPKTITLGKTDFSAFRIVYPAQSEILGETAQQLRKAIGLRSGYVLPVCPDKEEASAHEILIGKTDRAESLAFYGSEDAPSIAQFRAVVRGEKIIFAGGGSFSTQQAVQAFDSYLNASGGVLDAFSLRNDGLIKNVPACEADLRALSYNILVEYEGWGSGGSIPPAVEYRKEIVAALLLEYRPTVAALCEFFDTWWANLPELIAERYDFVQIDWTDGVSNRTPILYDREKLEVIASGYRDIESTQTQNRRVVTWAVFKNKSNGKQFSVFASHWDSQFAENRLSQAEQMATVIEEISGEYHVPVLAMGDFNCVAGSEAYERFTEKTELTRAETAPANVTVDHIFYGSEFTAVAADMETGNYTALASDHKPIYADLNFVNPSEP